jgi:multidrug efflux pump subunit AcrA (membrane-fusion protein)
MPAEVKLQAYQDQVYKGRLRQIFPSADRAKAIVEVRVTILNADEHVKPEMTASVTFQEKRAPEAGAQATADPTPQAPIVLIPKRTLTEQGGQPVVWVVTGGTTAARRAVKLGRERLDQVEVSSGVAPGEALVLNPPPTLTDRGPVRVKGK